jgi:general secretion pathway protein K
MKYLRNQKGIALIVTLLALALITAMVVEFAYGVYTGTNNLYNWRDSQRLSLMARSGVNVSARFLSDWLNTQKYTIGFVEMPIENPFEDFNGIITVRIEDENSKFNINSMVSSGGVFNERAYNSFQKLLKILLLDEKIADRVLDWIDPGSEAKLSDSEIGAKNYKLDSVDEILLIHGITRKDYDKLLPYVTAFGSRDNLIINVNGAEKPVLMCMYKNGEFPITEEIANNIIKYRESTPFDSFGKFNDLVKTIFSANEISFKGADFYIKSVASSGGVKRIIETVLNTDKANIEYWKEY